MSVSLPQDRDRRLELLRLYAGDLERAQEAECWIVWGTTAETGRGNLDAPSPVPAHAAGGLGIGCERLDLNQRPQGYEPRELPGCSTPPDEDTALALRAQIPTSTDPQRLEREAYMAENARRALALTAAREAEEAVKESLTTDDGLEIPAFLKRERVTA